MEISLDVPFVLDVLAKERELARDEIRQHGIVQAYENSRERHDARIAAAPDVGTLACRAGCTWCCHFSVDVRAVEVFSILDFVERTLSPEEKARVFSEVRTNATTLAGMDDIERMRHNVKCPFLSDGRCSIYTARPQTCRNYHATAVAGCQASFEDPDNLEIDPEFAPLVYQAGGAHVDAFTRAMREEGYDTNVYELNGALTAALSDTEARARFAAKTAPFQTLSGDEIPSEFEDLA